MENNKITKDPMTVNEARFVSLAPHIRANDTVRKIMLDVIIALVPAMIASVYFFGMRSILLILTCVVACVATEYVTQSALKKTVQIRDLSAVVTGILIALNMPQSFPLWMAAFGSVFSILIVKECFGGIGFNFMNPALAARLVLMASWPKQITGYISPELLKQGVTDLDSITYATPLQLIAAGDFANLPQMKDMFIGNIGGVIGETSAIALLIGFVYLVVRKVISWEIPVIYVATTAVCLGILGIPMNII
ncbi:MAG: RnfABCDGE type electron transport complex subunit D, partial [Peptoniphilus grossensis]